MMNKKLISKSALVALLLTIYSGQASAILIGSTEVGSEDNLLGQINSTSSGIETEETLLEGFIGGGADVELISNVTTFTQLVGGGYRALDVSPAEPGYFVLKFGAGNCNADPNCRDMFFFFEFGRSELSGLGRPDVDKQRAPFKSHPVTQPLCNHPTRCNHDALDDDTHNDNSNNYDTVDHNPPGSRTGIPVPSRHGFDRDERLRAPPTSVKPLLTQSFLGAPENRSGALFYLVSDTPLATRP